jgi:predicted Zn-dependent peptidase
MMFKGTPSRSAKEIAEAFDAIGGDINAFTAREETCYFAKVLDEHAESTLEILCDMLFHSLIDDEEFEKEKQVILEEINMYEDTPDDLVHDLLNVAAFGSHPLALPVLGTEKTLKNMTPDDLRNYIKQHYRPERMVVSVAGNVPDHFIETIEKAFSHLVKDPAGPALIKPVFQLNKTVREKETEQGHLCLGFEGLGGSDDDILPLLIMNNILGGNMSSRLFQEVRENKGLAYSIFSDHTEYKDCGLLSIYGGANRNQMPLLLDTILAVLNQVKKEGLTEKELQHSQSQLRGSVLLSLESSNYRMNRNAENELVYGEPKSADEILKAFENVTIKDVNRILKETLNGNYSISMVKPVN